MATDHPVFIYRYLDRTMLRNDSPRFRVRVSASFIDQFRGRFDQAAAKLKTKAGLLVTLPPQWYHWEKFWTSAPIEEIFSAITILYQYLKREYEQGAEFFRDAVSEAMQDEHLGFRIDSAGVIHFAVDEDFEVTERATLAGLSDTRLSTTRQAYERAHKFMVGDPPQTLLAIKSAFEAVEVLATQLVPAHKNLHGKLCKDELKKLSVPVLTSDQTEAEALAGLFDSMAEWVNAMHFYRHRKWHTAEPSVETSVLVLTTASGYLRMLAKVAAKVLP